MSRVSGTQLQKTYLDVSVEAQCRHEDPLDVLKRWRPLLLPVYVKGQVALVQIQENTNGGTFRNSSFGPKVQRDHTWRRQRATPPLLSRGQGSLTKQRAEQHGETIIPAAFGND